jgi:hypothetical protein
MSSTGRMMSRIGNNEHNRLQEEQYQQHDEHDTCHDKQDRTSLFSCMDQYYYNV